jgi:putative transposase
MHRGYRYRLSPTPEQEATFRQWVGVVRLIYNAALEQRRTYWRQYLENTGKKLAYAFQSREITDLRAEFEWIADVYRTPLDEAVRDLDGAFRRFFSGLAKYPKERRRGENDSFRFMGVNARIRKLNAKWSAILIPKIGWVKYRDTRSVPGAMKRVTVACRAEQWFVSIDCELDAPMTSPCATAVGIDRGVINTLTLSTGEMLQAPIALTVLERRQRRLRRVLSRRKRGSARYRRQRRRVAAMGSRIARIRRDWQHRTTTDIARRFGLVAIEDLNVPNMTASGGAHKRGLNRSILNQGWGAIGSMLRYKLEERGGVVATVPAHYTSQTCSSCGVVDAGSRESQARFHCRHCGHTAHADVNAAINILRRSTPATLVEGADYGPGETRTINHAALAA